MAAHAHTHHCDNVLLMAKRKRVKATRTNNNNNNTSCYLNFLRDCKHPPSVSSVLKTAPDTIVKTICNAAHNFHYNPTVRLSPTHRNLFRRYKRKISVLGDRKKSLRVKRRLLIQRGGALLFLPVLLGSALATLGARLFAK